MTAIDDVLASIFDASRPALYPAFEGWMRESRRFQAFAKDHHSKIRTKLKNVRDEGGMNDLRAELETAALLLREPRFTLEYEKYAASKQRGPDFTVTFKTHTPFNVEVRRIRGVELETADSGTPASKLINVLCDKVGQMPPSIINLLWLTARGGISEGDLNGAALTLRQMAERKTEDFFTRRGFTSAADFYKRFSLLSGIVLHQPETAALVIWVNLLARHKTPPDIVNAIRRLSAR